VPRQSQLMRGIVKSNRHVEPGGTIIPGRTTTPRHREVVCLPSMKNSHTRNRNQRESDLGIRACEVGGEFAFRLRSFKSPPGGCGRCRSRTQDVRCNRVSPNGLPKGPGRTKSTTAGGGKSTPFHKNEKPPAGYNAYRKQTPQNGGEQAGENTGKERGCADQSQRSGPQQRFGWIEGFFLLAPIRRRWGCTFGRDLNLQILQIWQKKTNVKSCIRWGIEREPGGDSRVLLRPRERWCDTGDTFHVQKNIAPVWSSASMSGKKAAADALPCSHPAAYAAGAPPLRVRGFHGSLSRLDSSATRGRGL